MFVIMRSQWQATVEAELIRMDVSRSYFGAVRTLKGSVILELDRQTRRRKNVAEATRGVAKLGGDIGSPCARRDAIN